MDIVVKSALQKGIVASTDISRVSWDDGVALDWRTLCKSLSESESLSGDKSLSEVRSGDIDMRGSGRDRADTLRRFAAEHYGFQSIIICEVGTLVLAHLLQNRLSPEIWRECFRLDCIPVAPHGKSLSSTDRLMLASPDPAYGAVRNLSRSVIPGQSTLVYADAPVVSGLKSLLVSNLRVVASAVENVADGAVQPGTSPAGLSTSFYRVAA